MTKAYIVTPLRSAVGKAFRGGLRTKRPDDLCADLIRAVLAKTPAFDPHEIDDCIVGCAMPEGEQGMNIGRFAALLAGLPESVPGVTVNRFCSSGLNTIAMAAQQIQAGGAHCILAGGTESMSMVPMMGNKPVGSRTVFDGNNGDYYLGMGLTAENVASDYNITRDEQDEFAVKSHEKALAAIEGGLFKAEIAPVEAEYRTPVAGGEVKVTTKTIDTDEGPRPGSSVAALSRLRPAFRLKGVVTAGNASQTSDGSAFTLIVSEKMVKELNLEPSARLVSCSVGGVDPLFMGIGPCIAIPKALNQAGLKISDIQQTELNEAFAAQALAVIQESGLDPNSVNVNGGAIAMGHPLGCTGAKLSVQLINEMKRRNQKYGMVTACVGGGQGIAGIFERL